ncbi:DMT family transporter [Ancylobacter terrae]|uniref:DMT family transporter n=1 Tax=Ancylobacter sp. sgz301288 TaxID=3342077 RepID=UPI00385F945C
MNALKGIALQLCATFLFTIMAALVRVVSVDVPTGQVMFARSFFALFPLIALLAFRGEISAAVRTANPVGHIIRGLVGVIGMACNFVALARIPLVDATAISFTTPLITVVMAALLLREVVRPYRWIAVMLGLAGVVIMLWPHLALGFGADVASTWGAIYGLCAAICTAGAIVQVRHLTATETTAAIVFYFQALASVAALGTAAWGWVVPGPGASALLLTIGFLGGVGQILLTESYRYAPASVIAPFTYSAMLWSLVLGFALFSEVPSLIVLVGAAIVIGAGLYMIWHERHEDEQRRREAEASGPPPVA